MQPVAKRLTTRRVVEGEGPSRPIARTSESSFDGVNPTYGYHLARASVLARRVARSRLFTWDEETHLKALFAVYLFLLYILSEVASADRFGRIRAPQGGRMRQDACHNLDLVQSIRSASAGQHALPDRWQRTCRVPS